MYVHYYDDRCVLFIYQVVGELIDFLCNIVVLKHSVLITASERRGVGLGWGGEDRCGLQAVGGGEGGDPPGCLRFSCPPSSCEKTFS